MTVQQILIVDDEIELRSMVRQYLTKEGFTVAEASTGQGALKAVSGMQPDLVLLDVGLPDIDGFEVLRSIRADSTLPVIMLTARDDEVDRVVGLTVGADDYVVKPFSPRELVARIRAVLRRATSVEEGSALLAFDGLTINLDSHEVHVDGRVASLSALEFKLLATLARSPHRVHTRDNLLERVWGWDHYGVDRVVDVHVGNIRKELGDDPSEPRFIATVRGVGYRFVADQV